MIDLNKKSPNTRKKAVVVLSLAICLVLAGILLTYPKEELPIATDNLKPEVIEEQTEAITPATEKQTDSCQNKTRCSDFSSCEEARFYQTHCDGAKLDKDHDGIPCEGTLCQHQ